MMRGPVTAQNLTISNSKGTSFANSINLVPAADIPPALTDWLWLNNLAKGKLHILAGAPGAGKTGISIYLAATISNGTSGLQWWPDGTPVRHGIVIIWTGEDGVADTIILRLIAAGANLRNILVLHGTVEHGRERAFDFTKDFELLKEKVEEIGDIALIIIDSIVQVVKGDAHKNSDVRQALAPLLDLGEKHGCAILGITHLNKNSKGKEPLDRINGSLAYGAAARIVLIAAKVKTSDHDAPSAGVLVKAKSNLGPTDGGFEYQIRPVTFQHDGKTFRTSKVEFNPTPIQGSAEEILKFAESGKAVDSVGAVGQAAQFLTELLAQGPMTFQQIEERAAAANIALSAIKRAKGSLGIKSEKQVGTGLPNPPTMWTLTSKSVTDQRDTTSMGAPKFSRPSTSPEHHQSRPARMSDFMGKLSPSARPDVAPVAPVAPADADASTTDQSAAKLNKPLLDLCSNECQRLLDHATSSSDDDALSSVDEIVEAAIKRFVGESAPGNKLIEKYRNALRQLDIFRNLE